MSKLLTVRFPSGTEFRMSDDAPKVGDILKRNGDNWLVEEIRETDDGKTVVILLPQPVVPGPDPDRDE